MVSMEISVASEVNSIFSGLELSESISGSNPPIVPKKINQGISNKSMRLLLNKLIAAILLALAATER